MAVDDSTSVLLSTLTNALESAASAFPDNEDQFLPPAEGISLLDIKNDLLLSYIQNLVFLVVLKLRNQGSSTDSTQDLAGEVVKKLVELRVHLERGIRPLESKLKYQIDKVVRAAEEADRRASQQASTGQESTKKATRRRTQDVDGEGSDDGAPVSDSGLDSEDSDEGAQLTGPTEAEISIGPRPAALLRSTTDKSQTNGSSRTTKSRTTDPGTGTGTSTGAYKPPRITPTAMPDPTATRERDRDQPARKRRSQLLDEYIDEEVSTAPRAQPSIGSNHTIVKHGRGAMSSRDREKERERLEYEERNFVRLPGESKAERRKARLRGERNQRDMFGGEDWTGLGGLGDRIHRTVAGRSRGEGANLLERREKRRRDTQDGPRGDGSAAGPGSGGGAGIGETFEKRRKIMQQRAEKKTRRRA
ncbi:hypothetical protein A1O3_06629 [Capronia epimyces CBS 606.96]|uniref:Uncharacterized protein n=1 Tax=Capronia epimyces CBS 606.96 TaxID=1182542 RepID=W9YKN0_9EURO|nr:uncharacterized protein A1O3_06629 [Capronia epimyces CBS 606.96]EXJ82814.1 hypothetical protein A1O3_06629 [Capronia epimyces CBS 606.96]